MKDCVKLMPRGFASEVAPHIGKMPYLGRAAGCRFHRGPGETGTSLLLQPEGSASSGRSVVGRGGDPEIGVRRRAVVGAKRTTAAPKVLAAHPRPAVAAQVEP